MRHQWYGDNRDLVKWGAMFHLVEAPTPTRLLYVPMLTPDDPAPSTLALNGRHPLSTQVCAFFRDVAHIARLQWPAHVTFDMVPGPMDDRVGYFGRTARAIDGATRDVARLLVLLDPDTGIAPASGGGSKHVRPAELAGVYGRLRAGDVLAVYQHRWRDKGWLGSAKGRLAAAVGVSVQSVLSFACPEVAADVAVLALEKEEKK